MNYWQDRIIKSQNAISNKNTKEIDAQMKKYYKSAMKKTIADFESTYDKLLATIKKEGREPTPADLYKLDKYWKMQSQLKKELEKLGDKEVKLLSGRFEKHYKEIYKSMALPSGEFFGSIDNELVREMINQVWVADGKSWSSRIWSNTETLAETLNEELISCVVSGRDTKELKRKLVERFNVSYSQANSLVQTEIAHIQTQASQRRYKDYGIGMVEIWADPDERRCEVCGKLHRKKYKVGDHVPIPAHPRCRCCIIPVIE